VQVTIINIVIICSIVTFCIIILVVKRRIITKKVKQALIIYFFTATIQLWVALALAPFVIKQFGGVVCYEHK
jgi:hypothetical protein